MLEAKFQWIYVDLFYGRAVVPGASGGYVQDGFFSSRGFICFGVLIKNCASCEMTRNCLIGIMNKGEAGEEERMRSMIRNSMSSCIRYAR